MRFTIKAKLALAFGLIIVLSLRRDCWRSVISEHSIPRSTSLSMVRPGGWI